ncbi:MAG: HAMP domain-containing histidine kinase [Planctomycetes bacterium]|nr:HAMP domain-containing histidine kinase [Planctomycetota bacterium]
MSRIVLLYILCILLPGAVLSALAFRLAARERDDAERSIARRLEEAAASCARPAESALAAAGARANAMLDAALSEETPDDTAEDDALVAFCSPGGAIRWTRDAPVTSSEDLAASEDELRCFRLSIEGGESYELAVGDAARAIDAYAFYLPRIRAPSLRAQLRFRVARAALADGQTPLATAILRGLVNEARGFFTEEGLPVDLLAMERLLALDLIDADARRDLAEQLRREHRRWPTALLEHIARRGALVDPDLERILAERASLEAKIRRQRERLRQVEAVLDGEDLLLGRSLPSGDLAVARALIEWPSFVLDGEWDVEIETEEAPRTSPPPGAIDRPLRIDGGAPIVARLRLTARAYDEEIARAERIWTFGCVLVAFTILLTLAGGFALLRILIRERRLTLLRARLLANVSHELKSPVTSIRMFSEMLAEDPLDDTRTRRFGKLLRAESLRLGQLIENLLDFSRLGRKEVDLEMEPVDVAGVLHRVAEGFGYRAREKGIAFEINLPDAERPAPSDERLVTVASAPAIERIALNLLDNALKYRRAETPRIRLSARRGERSVQVSVADNGPGIPAAERERVFEEFYRVRYDDYAIRGSGLGLALARRLARKMGGEIRLESRVGEGSTFTLEIPLRE